MNEKKQPIRRRKFDAEFKAEALRMIAKGQSASTVARSLNISKKLLSRRKSQQTSQRRRQSTDLSEEVSQLKAQLRRAEMERDIKKKALVIFGPGGEPQPT